MAEPGVSAPAPLDGPGAATLVVGYDDGPDAAHVLQTAAGLAQRLQASLVVVHALPGLPLLPVAPTVAGAAVAPPTAYGVPRDERETAGLSQAARGRAAQALDPTGVRWSWVCENGEPALLVEQQAEDRDALLVVVGAGEHGFGAAVERLVTGSTGRDLRRTLRRPLLLVPPVEEPEDAPG